MMDFTNMIKKYEKQLTVKSISEGHYVKGKWIQDYIEKHFLGTFLPLSPKDLRYTEGGGYTTQDKKLYVINDLIDINGDSLNLKEGDIIVEDTTEYEIKDILSAPEAVNYSRMLAKKKVVINE